MSCLGVRGGSRAVGFVICTPSPWDLQRVMENSERSSDTSLTGRGSSSNSLNSLLRLGLPSIFPKSPCHYYDYVLFWRHLKAQAVRSEACSGLHDPLWGIKDVLGCKKKAREDTGGELMATVSPWPSHEVG